MGHSCLFKARATSSSTYFIAALLVRDSEPTGSGILIRCSCKGAARWYLGGDFSLSPSFSLPFSLVLFPFSLVSSSPSFYFVLPSIRTRTFRPLRSLSPVFLTAISVALENRSSSVFCTDHTVHVIFTLMWNNRLWRNSAVSLILNF